MMDFRSIIPWGGGPVTRRYGASDPFASFRRDLDRLVEQTFGESRLAGWPVPGGPDVRLDVSEGDKEVKVTAELPGVDPKDVEVTIDDDLLTIKGEKKVEEERKEGETQVTERAYGSFARSLRLPFVVGDKDVQATFDKGVPSITLPKPPEAETKARRIDIQTAA
jgi:HSP20 family protein